MRARVPRHPAKAADRILVALALGVCRLVASLAALGRAVTLVVVSPGTLAALELRGGVWRSLWKTSFARVFHQLARAVPRLAHAAEIVLLEHLPRGGEPCVYALVHSHWNLLLARRAVDIGGPHVLASSRWTDRLVGVRVDPGSRGLRRLVGALRTGESAAVMADRLDGRGEPVELLGRQTRLSNDAARLAAAGRVPLVPIAVAISRGRVRIRRGSAILVDPNPEGLARATRTLAAFFDVAIREDADVWYRFLPYLARRPADPLSSGGPRPRRRIAQRIPSAR
jgi:hypothetical protein